MVTIIMNRVTLKQICFLLLFFLTASSYKLNAQPDAVVTKEECQQLAKKGYNLIEKNEYSKGLEYLTKAEVLAKKNNWTRELTSIKNDLGRSYTRLSNYGEAMGYYIQALALAKNDPKLEDYSLSIINNIGNLYHQEKDFQSALKYYKEAYKIVNDKKVQHLIMPIALNIADIYNIQGNFKEAKKYLLEVENVSSEKNFKEVWKVNYAESLFLEGKVQQAETILNKVVDEIDKVKDINCYVALLSKIADKNNNIAVAITFAQDGLKDNTELTDRIDIYDHLSALNFKKKQYEEAIKYKDSARLVEHKLAQAMKRGLYESNKVKLKVQEYQNELQAKTDKQRNERILFGIGILSTLMLFFFVYRLQKIRIAKQKQANVIAEKQQQILNLEMENLKNNIAEKNRKLSTKALYLSGRNEIIEEIMDALSQQQVVAQNPEITNYIKTLKNYLKTDAEWDDFINYFEQVNHDFFKALNLKHPQLTPPDIRFLCYIYMNLDIKEISTIFSITSDAARKRKQRIAKKMGVEVDDLHEYILKINEPAV
jgi:Flp pilus assembly protein TadD